MTTKQPAIIAAAEKFVKDRLYDEATGHDWWHVERVRATGRSLQSTEGGDATVIDLALLLHDVGDRKVIGQDDDDYTIAEGFLRDNKVSNEMVQTIMEIIKNMSFSKSLDSDTKAPTSIEFQIVQDADRLDALGAVGIARAFAFGGSRARPLYNPDVQATNYKSRSEYIASQGSTLHHFDEKLFHLKDKLNTRTAKELAAQRDAYMHEFYQQFLGEWYGRA